MSDQKDQLYAALSALTGRRLELAEVQKAVGLSRAQYYQASNNGDLLRADRLITVAHHMGVNPVELLVMLGGIELSDAARLVDDRRRMVAELAGEPD